MVIVVALNACGGDSVSRQIGARCDTASECDERCLPPGGDYPGGFCTVDCQTTGECPDDAQCANEEGGVCLFECLDNADCAFLGETWTCRERDLRADESIKVKVCMGA